MQQVAVVLNKGGGSYHLELSEGAEYMLGKTLLNNLWHEAKELAYEDACALVAVMEWELQQRPEPPQYEDIFRVSNLVWLSHWIDLTVNTDVARLEKELNKGFLSQVRLFKCRRTSRGIRVGCFVSFLIPSDEDFVHPWEQPEKEESDAGRLN